MSNSGFENVEESVLLARGDASSTNSLSSENPALSAKNAALTENESTSSTNSLNSENPASSARNAAPIEDESTSSTNSLNPENPALSAQTAAPIENESIISPSSGQTSRFNLLRDTYRQAFINVASAVSAEELAEMFQDLDEFKRKPNLPHKMADVLKSTMLECMISNMDEQFVAENVEEKLNKLDSVFPMNSDPDLPPDWDERNGIEKYLTPFIIEDKKRTLEELKKMVLEKEEKADELFSQVRHVRKRFENCKLVYDNTQSDIEKCIEQLESLNGSLHEESENEVSNN